MDKNIGKTFGRYTVIERVENGAGWAKRYRCRCECGVEKIVRLRNLKKDTVSCGCYNKDKMITHGLSKSRIYRTWTNIVARCTRPSAISYPNYGGRGIKCHWNDFESFYKDMGPSYKDGLEIDRIDTNGHYCKSNCRWVTHADNAKNRRTSIIYKGETARDASKRLGGSSHLVQNRIKRGMPVAEAFTKLSLKKK